MLGHSIQDGQVSSVARTPTGLEPSTPRRVEDGSSPGAVQGGLRGAGQAWNPMWVGVTQRNRLSPAYWAESGWRGWLGRRGHWGTWYLSAGSEGDLEVASQGCPWRKKPFPPAHGDASMGFFFPPSLCFPVFSHFPAMNTITWVMEK